MKSQLKFVLTFSLFASSFYCNKINAQIPMKEVDFVNPSNFPTIPGDAMVKSRTNYYRDLSNVFTRKADGNLYLNEGGWGSSQVDSNGNLIFYIARFNGANRNYFRSASMLTWNLTTQPEYQNGFFRLYTNLILTPTNPTASNTTSDFKTLRKATSNETFPYFNSYPTIGQDTVYNWQSWLYPLATGATNVDPKTANAQRNAYVKPGLTTVYRDYNYATLRDNNQSNDLTANALDQNYELNLSASPSAPTVIYTRINNNRNKLILSIWYGYKPLAGVASKPMADLRISGWDTTYSMNYKLWFNSIAAVNPSASDNEYQKIKLANGIAQTINNLNNGKGADIREFNSRFDEVSDLAEDVLSGGTEAAMELNGKRSLAYNYDIDNYGQTSKTIQLKFRMLTVGMNFDAAKITQRVFNTTFSTLERLQNIQDYRDFKDTFNFRKVNFFHPKHPFGLTPEQYINIISSRPAIAFNLTDAESVSNIYKGSTLNMTMGADSVISVLNLEINENVDAKLPFQELNTVAASPLIDTSRVRVSLLSKTVYDQAVADNSILTNNDLTPISGFAYLTQSQMVALQSSIPQGEYVLKYDYSSPDSKTTIKTDGAGLGEVFAKSIYRPLVVNVPLPLSLTKFTATYSNQVVVLDWVTSWESNLKHFEIEHSVDSRNYTKIGSVQANNFNSTYQYIDKNPYLGVNYYKLKSIDKEGSSQYSDVRKVAISTLESVVVFPNPAVDEIIVNNAGTNTIQILSSESGKLIKTVNGEGTTTKISIKDLPKGLYIIKISNKNLKLCIL